MSSLKRYPQVPSLKKEIRLLKSPNQKLTAESQQQASSSIILTGNTQYESKRTEDSIKIINKKEQSCFCNAQRSNKSINAGFNFNPFLTSEKMNDSNYCSCDESPFHYQTCRKSLIVENQKNQYPTNFQSHSREASSNISHASHLNLSKYIQDSQTVNSDDEQVQVQTPNLPINQAQPRSPYALKGFILEKNNKELIQNLNGPSSILNNSNRDNQFKQQSFFMNQDMNKSSTQQNISFSNSSQLNIKGNKHIQLKSPLSYSNLLKSLAKYTKIESDLLEETIILEKQIQDSQEKINQLISNSNREHSQEQNNEQSINNNNNNNSKAKAQLLNIFNLRKKNNHSQISQNAENSFNGVYNLQSSKGKLRKNFLSSSQAQQMQQNSQQIIDKKFKKSSQMFKANINSRSQKNRFQDNITKLRQFQKEILKTEESFSNLNSNNNNNNNQFSSQQNLSFNFNTNVLDDSRLLSLKRKGTPQKNTQQQIKYQTIARVQKKEQLSIPVSLGQINSSCSNIVSNTPQSGLQQKNKIMNNNSQERNQEIGKNSSVLMRLSNEQFPFQLFQTERLQKSSSNKSVEKMEIEKFQNYFVKTHSQIGSIIQNEQYQSQNYDQLSASVQTKPRSDKSQTSIQQTQQQQAKSNKKLEILNLLSKINSKQITGLQQKQNKSYTIFEKPEVLTPTSNPDLKINFNQSKNSSYSQLFTESARKSSPQNLSSQSKMNYSSQKEMKNNTTQSSQIEKCKSQNTLAENLKILFQGNQTKNILNKSGLQQSSNTNRSKNSNPNNSNQNISMKNLLQHIFSKTNKNDASKN